MNLRGKKVRSTDPDISKKWHFPEGGHSGWVEVGRNGAEVFMMSHVGMRSDAAELRAIAGVLVLAAEEMEAR